jgi:hypothetical protein
MHGLPTIVVMNMTDEQREVYNQQESERIARREERERIDREYFATLSKFWGSVAVVIAMAVISFYIV